MVRVAVGLPMTPVDPKRDLLPANRNVEIAEAVGAPEVASFLAKAGLTEHLEVAWFLAKAGLTFDEADMRECGLDPGQAALVRRTLQELAAVAAEARQEKPETLSGRGKSKGKGKRQSGHGKSKDKGKHSTCNEVLVQVLALVLVLVLVLAVLVLVLAVVPVLVLVLVLILVLVLALVLVLLQY